ncbi:hypothetical protein BGZ94_007510 [Podila epigama]|nr:hypothetical protein BGZ94_007510 [Podila epigama]
MRSYRSFCSLAMLQTLALLAILSNWTGGNSGVLAAGLSVPCNNCLVGQLNSLPTCVNINLTNSTQQTTPEFKTCICDASFDFGWTNPCANTCQPSELATFKADFSVIITSLNLNCIKPTPTPTPTPSPTPTPNAATTKASLMTSWTLAFGAIMSLIAMAQL